NRKLVMKELPPVSNRSGNNKKHHKSTLDVNLTNISKISKKHQRKDAYGNTIKKGNSKKYKVTFSDMVKPKNNGSSSDRNKNRTGELISYVDIESFKIYNVDISQDNFNIA